MSKLRKKFIGDGVFYSRIFRIMIPILIQNLITNFVSLLDNIMVGRVGTEPMSGVAIDNQILFVFNLAIFGILSGCGVLGAQYFGKGDIKGVSNTFKLKLYTSFVLLVSAFCLFIFKGDFLIWQFLHEGEAGLDLNVTFGYAKAYLRVMLYGIVPYCVSQMYSSTLREISQTIVPMRAGLAAVFVNLVFNYILIYGKFGAPALGVEGAAYATVLSRIVECAIIMIWTHTHKEEASFAVGVYKDMRVPLPIVKQGIFLAVPLFINELLWGAGQTCLNQIMSQRGLEVLSAINISSTVSNLFACAYLAIGVSLSINVGQVLGSGDLDRAVDEARKTTFFSFSVTLIIGIIMVLFAPLIPEIYKSDAAVKELAATFIKIVACHLPLGAVINAHYHTIRCGGKTLVTFLFDSFYTWVFTVPMAYLVVNRTGLPVAVCYAIIFGGDIVKYTIGQILVCRKLWVVNLVGKKTE